jgi:HK97 family phage major capsid protein
MFNLALLLESWLFQKVSDGMRATINEAIMIGDGLGKPAGLLHPSSGIPICETSEATQPGQFSWQDLVMLKFELPMQWHAGASYLMNQRTFRRKWCSPVAQQTPYAARGSVER